MKKDTNPLEQCEMIINLVGECPGMWECNECVIYPTLCDNHGGDCYMGTAFETALYMKADIECDGQCDSIWKD